MANKTQASLEGVERLAQQLDVWNPTLAMLPAANRKPLSVSRETSLSRARTLMLMNDFSQLPVMNGDRTLHGMVSWKSIGRISVRRQSGKLVGDYLDDKPQTLRSDTPLLDAINEIISREVVLVRSHDRSIVGLVTTTDLSEQLRTLSEAFLLLGAIEHHLRRLIQQAGFTVDQLRAFRSPESAREVTGVSDLSFGEYVRLLDSPDNWARFELDMDRVELVKRLNKVRVTRNRVMHFRQNTSDTDLIELRNTVRFLKHL